MDLPANTAVGRNSQNVSVNGARTTQNNYQINGVDANFIRNNNLINLAVPAPESIQEFKVQTSLYDATFGRSGGGNNSSRHQKRRERVSRRSLRILPQRRTECE